MENLFKERKNIFRWKDIKTYLIRSQYNEMLKFVSKEYFETQHTGSKPTFLDENYCLTLVKYDETCYKVQAISKPGTSPTPEEETYKMAKKTHDDAMDEFNLARLKLLHIWENGTLELPEPATEDGKNMRTSFKTKLEAGGGAEFKELIDGLNKYKIKGAKDSLIKKFQENVEFNSFEAAYGKTKTTSEDLKIAEIAFKSNLDSAYFAYLDAENGLKKAKREDEFKPSADTAGEMVTAQRIFDKAKADYQKLRSNRTGATDPQDCQDMEINYFCAPFFRYTRKIQLNSNPKNIDLSFATRGLTAGTVLWLYYYERMGIFKILGALMDDYNYQGRYPMTGNRINYNDLPVKYSELMDMICTLHRAGYGSNLRDRVATYQRVLGVDLENNTGVSSERNTGFMSTFQKLMNQMLEYYNDKRLATAIQTGGQPRSSVATQTSVLDIMNLLKQQFEPLQYGRNQINAFLGIATVHATICLLYMIRKDIGIPDQYDEVEEFIPAAYDILVAKRSITQNEANRFIIYNNCATYGYRLLTDIETAELSQLNVSADGSTLNTWLDDVESLVEGYRNAYAAVPERAVEMV